MSSKQLLKVFFIGGKGGVGKTTVSGAMAYSLAREAKTILISTDPAHSVAHSLDVQVREGIYSVDSFDFDVWELNAENEYQEFIDKHKEEFRLILDTSTYLDNDDINNFLSLALPGIDEIMGFKSITDLIRAGTYHNYVIDTAPTGHALRLLMMPELLDEWVRQLAALRWKYREVQKAFKGSYQPDSGDDILLDLKKSVLKMRSILKDKVHTRFFVVAKPERMIVEESIEMKRKLESYDVFVSHLVINNCVEGRSDCDWCRQASKAQRPWKENLNQHFGDQKIVEIPWYPEPVGGSKDLMKLADLFTANI